VVSPHDLALEVHERVHEYLEAGAGVAWVLWPAERSVTAYRPGGQIRELGADEILDGGDVLPGFRAAVSALFEIPVRPQI
jgi:Putative restriction endonuclease